MSLFTQISDLCSEVGSFIDEEAFELVENQLQGLGASVTDQWNSISCDVAQVCTDVVHLLSGHCGGSRTLLDSPPDIPQAAEIPMYVYPGALKPDEGGLDLPTGPSLLDTKNRNIDDSEAELLVRNAILVPTLLYPEKVTNNNEWSSWIQLDDTSAFETRDESFKRTVIAEDWYKLPDAFLSPKSVSETRNELPSSKDKDGSEDQDVSENGDDSDYEDDSEEESSDYEDDSEEEETSNYEDDKSSENEDDSAEDDESSKNKDNPEGEEGSLENGDNFTEDESSENDNDSKEEVDESSSEDEDEIEELQAEGDSAEPNKKCQSDKKDASETFSTKNSISDEEYERIEDVGFSESEWMVITWINRTRTQIH